MGPFRADNGAVTVDRGRHGFEVLCITCAAERGAFNGAIARRNNFDHFGSHSHHRHSVIRIHSSGQE